MVARRRDGMRRGSRRSFSGLLITIALHAGIFWAVKTAHSRTQEPLIVPRDFVQAEMVKLGKPRDKFWLPKVHQPPPPPPPDATKISRNPDAGAAPPEAPKVNDPKTPKGVQTALQHARKFESLIVPDEEEGSATGSKMGTSDTAKGDQYDASVAAAVRQNYTTPAGLAPDQIATPPEIQFRVGADGTISGVKLLKSSGNPLVDDACISAAQQTHQVDKPPSGKAKPFAIACRK
jgi:protein TonB